MKRVQMFYAAGNHLSLNLQFETNRDKYLYTAAILWFFQNILPNVSRLTRY